MFRPFLNADLLLQAIELFDEGVIIIDARQHDYPIIYANKAFEKQTGYSESEIVRSSLLFVFKEIGGKDKLDRVKEFLQTKKASQTDFFLSHQDKTKYMARLSLAPLFSSSKQITHFVGILKILVGHNEAISTESKGSNVDSITGLNTLKGLDFYLDRLKNLRGSHKQCVALILFVIDSYKSILDSSGPLVSNKVAVIIADSLVMIHRKADLIARIADDRFGILLVSDTEIDIKKYEARLSEQLNQLLRKSELPCPVTLSSGSAKQTLNTPKNLDVLLQEAEADLRESR